MHELKPRHLLLKFATEFRRPSFRLLLHLDLEENWPSNELSFMSVSDQDYLTLSRIMAMYVRRAV